MTARRRGLDDVRWGVVIVAAGRGARFGAGMPKQFVDLAGRTVIDWSLDTFRFTVPAAEIVVVTPPADNDRHFRWTPPPGVRTVPGGIRRQDSVMAGLRALESSSHVLIHDSARPLVSPGLIERVMNGAVEAGAAVPVIPVRDTVKTVSDRSRISSSVPREGLGLSQTPQGFLLEELRAVLEGAGEVTDECAAMEAAGRSVIAVRGDPMNMKITDPADHRMLEALARGCAGSRTGFGLDFHPFREGIPLMLAGCRLESDSGLDGHSDGDAVLHAVADALLSAARLGDIGTHFPPDDAEWEDADSARILGGAAEMVRDQGWEVAQLDITVIAAFPRIAPVRDSMISRVAGILGIPASRIWIKGTTTNSLGDIGRGRGLGCMAAAVLISRFHPPAGSDGTR